MCHRSPSFLPRSLSAPAAIHPTWASSGLPARRPLAPLARWVSRCLPGALLSPFLLLGACHSALVPGTCLSVQFSAAFLESLFTFLIPGGNQEGAGLASHTRAGREAPLRAARGRVCAVTSLSPDSLILELARSSWAWRRADGDAGEGRGPAPAPRTASARVAPLDKLQRSGRSRGRCLSEDRAPSTGDVCASWGRELCVCDLLHTRLIPKRPRAEPASHQRPGPPVLTHARSPRPRAEDRLVSVV